MGAKKCPHCGGTGRVKSETIAVHDSRETATLLRRPVFGKYQQSARRRGPWEDVPVDRRGRCQITARYWRHLPGAQNNPTFIKIVACSAKESARHSLGRS